jgi:carbonic anhydrase
VQGGDEENKTLQKILAHVPEDKGVEHPLNAKINPADFLPEKLDYYSFMGSLTTPPCSEGLQWIVLANPVTVSPPQIVNTKQANGGVNARPVQALNKREVYFSEDK